MSEQLMLFTEGFPVSPSAWQEGRRDKTIHDIYGRNFRGWSQKLDRVGLSLKMYLEYCVSQLMTYAGTWSVKATAVGIWDFEAACVGAKHRRERIFFVAHSRCNLQQRSEQQRELRAQTEARIAFEPERSGCISFSDTVSSRMQSCRQQETHSFIGGCGRWEPEPGMDRVANGIPSRVDRLKALGNAVVPQQAYPVFKAIMEAEAYEQIQP